MGNLIEQIISFLNELRLDAKVGLTKWTPNAFNDLIEKLWQVLVAAFGFLFVALIVNWATGWTWLTPLFGIAYTVILLAFILPTKRSLNAAGLALATDVALDILKAATPLEIERMKKMAGLNISWDRTKQAATIQILLVAVTSVWIVMLLLTFYFGLVWVGNHPTVLPALIVLVLAYGGLQTPWMTNSGLRKLGRYMVIGIVALAVYMALPPNVSLSADGFVRVVIYSFRPLTYLVMLGILMAAVRMAWNKDFGKAASALALALVMGMLAPLGLNVVEAQAPPAELSATPSSSGTEWRVTIPATCQFCPTGIQVPRGAKVTIRQAKPAEMWEWDQTSGHACNGSGAGPWPGLVVPNAGLAAVVGQVGNGAPFAAYGYDGTPGQGELLLGCNDIPGGQGDNKKSIDYIVTLN